MKNRSAVQEKVPLVLVPVGTPGRHIYIYIYIYMHKYNNNNNNNKCICVYMCICMCMCVYIYIYKYVYVCIYVYNTPSITVETIYSWAPVKPQRGQTLRSTRPKVTSLLTRPFFGADGRWDMSPVVSSLENKLSSVICLLDMSPRRARLQFGSQ